MSIGTRALGLPQNPDRRLGNNAELPFRADGEAKQIVAFRVEIIAAQFDDLAIHQNHFELQYVIRGHAVFQAMRAARVHGDIAANGAGELARWIGRVEEPRLANRIRDSQIGDTRLHGCGPVREIHVQNPVHAGKAQDDAVFQGQRASAKRCSCPARDNLDTVFTAKFKYTANFRRSLWQYCG